MQPSPLSAERYALVVDDSRTICTILKRLLNEIGYTVSTANDGRQALESLKAGPVPELILVDWNMPVMDGLEFVKRLRADESYTAVKCLMVTTETELERVSSALEAGADEYIMKPFAKEAVVEKLELLGLGA